MTLNNLIAHQSSKNVQQLAAQRAGSRSRSFSGEQNSNKAKQEASGPQLVRPKPIRAPEVAEPPVLQPVKSAPAGRQGGLGNTQRIQDLLLRVGELIHLNGRGTGAAEDQELQQRGNAPSDELHCTSAPTAESNGKLMTSLGSLAEVNRRKQ